MHLPGMQPTKDEIKAWLKTAGHSRSWLGEQCGGITKRTVDNWLSSPQEIPAGSLALIARLMAEDDAAEAARLRRAAGAEAQIFSVEVDLPTFRAYNKAALDRNLTIEQWVIQTCDEEVSRLSRKIIPIAAPATAIPVSPARERERERSRDIAARVKHHWIDLLGGIAAGSPVSSDVDTAPIEVAKEYPDDHYALRVFGQSMAPKITDGDTIIVRRWQDQGFPKKGTLVVYNDAHGATLKEFGYRKAKPGEDGDTFNNIPVLKSLNPAFREVQTMEGGRIDAVFVELV